MITNGFYEALAALMSTADAGACITQIGFGTGTDAATETDTALSDDAYVRDIDSVSVSDDDPRTIRFTWSLGQTEANGLAITEFGLLTADGTLVARKVRTYPIHKTADMSLGDYFDITL